MAPIVVIPAPKQRGRLIEPGGLQSGQVLRQSIDFLVHIGLEDVANAAFGKRVLFLPGAAEPEEFQTTMPPCVLGQYVAQGQ
ncbi:hypothetical protein GY15_30870 [Delftia sp. 670]|nr:hypothetical protein GY15_30870 [Delftia sp. 670]